MSNANEELKKSRALLTANRLCYECSQDKGDSTGVRCASCTLKNRARAKASRKRNKLDSDIAAVVANPERAAAKLVLMRAKIAALTRFISQHGLNARAPERRAPHRVKYFPSSAPVFRLRRLEELNTVAMNEDERVRIYNARRYWRGCVKRTA